MTLASITPRRVYGVLDLFYGAVLGAVIFGVLPERHAVIDALGSASSLVLLTAGLALLLDAPWAARAARGACAVVLVLGVVLIGGVIGSVGFLHGIYGAVGELGVSVLCVIAALAVPYTIVFPLLQLAHLRTPLPPPDAPA